MNREESKLMREVSASTRWPHCPPFVYVAYIVPIAIVASYFVLWAVLTADVDYCLAVRVGNTLQPVGIDLRLAVFAAVLLSGLLALAGAHLAVCQWRERRVFGRIFEQREAVSELMHDR